ncbi:DUF2480 family protein [Mongoliitalea daihaiensis]|uniref:DUF2480 family protein n=1 Tax=Mongoliitalea daihaiensis TaxID=2782006 RepID=UPI001F2C4226|nr:DUF2480 family protein [Mongoliitalea daihaiensis]UJP66620.1 DUF2480 family protein [Mongoliitalea daihaiensis]
MSEIINRVANSPIRTIDLEDYYDARDRVIFDLKPFLFQELILREKDFREALKMLDWSQYFGKAVAITCTTDAIVPNWAFILVGTYLHQIHVPFVIGTLEALEQYLFDQAIQALDITDYADKPIVIKGCSKFPLPLYAYGKVLALLQGTAKSVMYGEPCSTVPLYKRPKNN